MADLTPIFCRVVDAPAVFGLSRATIYRMVKSGDLNLYRLGTMSFLKVSEVAALIEGRARPVGPDVGPAPGAKSKAKR